MSKAVIFVRVSTDKQHLESQESTLRTSAVADGFDESDIIFIGKKESGYKLDEDEIAAAEAKYRAEVLKKHKQTLEKSINENNALSISNCYAPYNCTTLRISQYQQQ